MKKLAILITFLSVSICFSQISKTINVKYINEPITVDAVLDEDAWGMAEPSPNFWQYFPTDSIQAKQQTEIKMLFDNKNLYIGMKVNASGKNLSFHLYVVISELQEMII